MSTEINIKKKIAVSEESTIITTDVSSIDFVGAGVTASTIGNDVTVTINGAPTGVTSVGLSMPSAFSVSNSPIISSGTIAVTGAGTVSQYVRGDGTLANFPNSTGGGSSVNYYLNGSVSQGTFGGDIYYQMSKTPILGAGTNFIRTNGAGNGYIASFITDAGDPLLLNIPGGNWNLEFYFQSSASGNSPQFYAEIYKVSATNVFTLVASGSANPEGITNGTTIDQYFTSLPVPQTSLVITDRLAIRIYVITSGRTITLHTENGNLCEVLTTFTTGLTALNGLTSQVQYFATGTSGADFNISSVTDTHTFNLPTASAVNRGALSSANWTTFNSKVDGSGTTNYVSKFTASGTLGDSNIYSIGTNTGIGVTTPISPLHISSVNKTISNTLYTSDYITLSAEATAPGFNIITSSDTGGHRGVFKSTRSRGTLDIPTAVINGDQTMSIVAAGHDGTTNLTTAGITFAVDGAVSTNVLPQAITFATGPGNTRIERMRITSAGNVGINTTNPGAALTVRATAVPSAGETIASFQVSDSTATIGIQNASNTDNVFTPSLVANQVAGTSQTALNLTGYINSAEDTGATPIMTFRAALSTFTTASTRPLFDFRNWSTSVMTIAASGNVGIGTITPSTKLHIESSTSGIFRLVDTTQGADKYLKSDANGVGTWSSLSVAFSPQDVSSADTAPTAASTQYYYQTISTVTGTISKVKLWGFSGTDLVRFGIYRGVLGGSMTLIGQGSLTCGLGPNEIPLTAEIGQTLNLVVGENLVVGYYADGISWRTVYDVGISDALFGIINTANITTMPATPTGTATAIRFACTLYS